MECVFCKIVSGKLPGHKIYEDDDVLAFLDIYPETDGHTLIIPKKHFVDILDTPEELIRKIAAITKKLAVEYGKKLNCQGFRVMQSTGKLAGQVVFHYHVHLIPKYDHQKKRELKVVYDEIIRKN